MHKFTQTCFFFRTFAVDGVVVQWWFVTCGCDGAAFQLHLTQCCAGGTASPVVNLIP